MPTVTETEDRLRHTLHAVASSVPESEEATQDVAAVGSPFVTSPAPGRVSGYQRRSPLLVFAASFLAVLLVGAISTLTSGTGPGRDLDRTVEPGSATDPVPVTTVAQPADQSSLDSTVPPVELSATAEFWADTLAGRVGTVSQWGTFGPDEPEAHAGVVDVRETGNPFGSDGSIVATVLSADGQLTVRAEYQGRGERIGETALQADIAELTADVTAKHVTTYWYAPDADSESGEEELRAEFFLTELEPGLARMTVLSARGRLVVDVDAADSSLLLDVDQQMGIASGMMGTSLDLTWNPDHALSTEVETLPEPAADAWIALDDDLWVASVDEGDADRLWVKTDIQSPASAPSTDTRSIFAHAGSDFVVIVVGEPVPDEITVNWDDGSTESVEPAWNTDLNMGFARFDNKAAALVSVDGP